MLRLFVADYILSAFIITSLLLLWHIPLFSPFCSVSKLFLFLLSILLVSFLLLPSLIFSSTGVVLFMLDQWVDGSLWILLSPHNYFSRVKAVLYKWNQQQPLQFLPRWGSLWGDFHYLHASMKHCCSVCTSCLPAVFCIPIYIWFLLHCSWSSNFFSVL